MNFFRGLILIISISLWGQCVHAFNWIDLWLTPDQQAKKLMEQGDFTTAKEKFERTDWGASAAYKAGDYERAAQLFKKIKTQQGYYNQGNALAHLGQYEQALNAYHQALTLDSNDKDAAYNQKLISELLKQQQSKDQQNKDQQNKDQQNKDQQNKDQQNKDQQNKDQQNKDQQNKDQQNKDQQNKDQQNKDQQNKDQQSKDQQNKDQQNKDQQNKDQQNKDQQNKDQQNKDQQNKDQQSKAQQNKNQDNKESKSQEQDSSSETQQEQKQAKDQWLRLIPDDPGGLLREKFLRDHLRRST